MKENIPGCGRQQGKSKQAEWMRAQSGTAPDPTQTGKGSNFRQEQRWPDSDSEQSEVTQGNAVKGYDSFLHTLSLHCYLWNVFSVSLHSSGSWGPRTGGQKHVMSWS